MLTTWAPWRLRLASNLKTLSRSGKRLFQLVEELLQSCTVDDWLLQSSEIKGIERAFTPGTYRHSWTVHLHNQSSPLCLLDYGWGFFKLGDI